MSNQDARSPHVFFSLWCAKKKNTDPFSVQEKFAHNFATKQERLFVKNIRVKRWTTMSTRVPEKSFASRAISMNDSQCIHNPSGLYIHRTNEENISSPILVGAHRNRDDCPNIPSDQKSQF